MYSEGMSIPHRPNQRATLSRRGIFLSTNWARRVCRCTGIRDRSRAEKYNAVSSLILEVVHEGVVRLAASNVHHGADGLQVVVCQSRVVVDPIVRYPGWWSPEVWDRRQVLEVRVHVVL